MNIEYGDYVQLVLSDTGTGIDKELLEPLFKAAKHYRLIIDDGKFE